MPDSAADVTQEMSHAFHVAGGTLSLDIKTGSFGGTATLSSGTLSTFTDIDSVNGFIAEAGNTAVVTLNSPTPYNCTVTVNPAVYVPTQHKPQ